tara:strand:- start:2815 stop:6396 length:3582 start_codon:yes stop_codon:yes gene_type:complete
MPFNLDDIYTSSGSVMLQNSWTPYVSKYDTSSFYNWEQDNLPLYDLEERTFENWEQAGYPTSSVTGFALTVSADAANTTEGVATLLANNNVFTQLSSCIAAIPKVVRFPVLIEVGSWGDLGPLELHNFRIEEGGSIEIINRNYSKVFNASGDCEDTVATPVYNNSHPLLTTLSSLDLSTTLTATKCINLGTLVVSGEDDERLLESNGNSVFYPKHTLRKAPLTVAFAANPQTIAGAGSINEFAFPPYESINIAADLTRGSIDVSATNQATNDTIYRAGLSDPERLSVGGNTYFNKCTKISVKNCDGPIYIRNFFVDGQTTEPVAIEVNNSEVLLENCAGVRAQEAGFRFSNSKVTLSRSAASYRNYKLTTTTTRKAQVGYGFHAVNSEVNVSSLPTSGYSGSGVDCVVMASRNYAGWVLDNSKLTGGVQRSISSDPLRGSIIGSELNTGYGMILKNSQVDVKGLLDIYGDDKGIQSDGSEVVFENLCIDAHSGEAIRARNSSFLFDSPQNPGAAGQAIRKQLDMSANGQHIDLMKNSSFGFRRKNKIPSVYGNTSFQSSHGVIKWASDDGTSTANRSTLPALSVNDGSELDLLHAKILVDETTENIANVPSYGRAIKATHNSKVSCYGTSAGCTFAFGPAGITYQAKMAGMYASDSSEINIHGPAALGQFGVDILVENNSTLNIQPARTRDAFGLEVSAFDLSAPSNHTSVELHATRACLVANKNSVINLADLGAFPQNWRNSSVGDGYLNAGFDYPINTYGTSAYTANGSLQFYPNPQDTSTLDFFKLDELTSAAGLNFTVPNFPVFTPLGRLNRFFLTADIIDAVSYTNLDKVTQGGVCLRATEDSVVNVKNVHFPLGTNSSPLDGHYYTASGSDCGKLMIWNIADTSRLNASFLSVSGLWPGSSQFHGPSSIYASSYNGAGVGDAWDAPAHGAPVNTPDTGSLSIHDAFGAGSSVWFVPSGVTVNNPFDSYSMISGGPDNYLNIEAVSSLVGAGINVSGSTTYKLGSTEHTSDNQGVFRIYWTPKASARALQSDMSGYFKGSYPHAGPFSGVVGPAYQTFAQGYNCSAPLSAIHFDDGRNVSGTYPDLLKLSYDTNYDKCPDQLWTSGFYYCKEFVQDNPSQCLLDESASYTFANARNASVGLAGRPRKVTILSSKSDVSINRTSEAYVGDTSGGVGFKSASIFDLSRDN